MCASCTLCFMSRASTCHWRNSRGSASGEAVPQAIRRLVVGLGFGLYGGLFGGLNAGGRACLEHFALRLLLIRSGSIPWNYVKFLNYAAERICFAKSAAAIPSSTECCWSSSPLDTMSPRSKPHRTPSHPRSNGSGWHRLRPRADHPASPSDRPPIVSRREPSQHRGQADTDINRRPLFPPAGGRLDPTRQRSQAFSI